MQGNRETRDAIKKGKTKEYIEFQLFPFYKAYTERVREITPYIRKIPFLSPKIIGADYFHIALEKKWPLPETAGHSGAL